MLKQWQRTNASALIAALRPGGRCWGESPALSRFLTLHKGDLITDLSKEPPTRQFYWRICGNPDEHRRYAQDIRKVIVWLGDPAEISA